MKLRLLLFSTLLVAASASAQWSNASSVNTPICTATNTQTGHVVVSDGLNGCYVAWMDLRLGVMQYDIFAQHFDSTGTPLWTANGLQVCSASLDQMNPTMVSDGAGGIIIAWDDRRSGNNEDIYAQRINAAGAMQWTANGVPVCVVSGSYQGLAKSVEDGSGGAIISWRDDRNGNADIYAQRINGSGITQWTLNGEPVCTATAVQEKGGIVSDGAGGAILTWQDSRNGATNVDVYAQRISSAGISQWTMNGVAVCTAIDYQQGVKICAGNAGTSFIVWHDYRAGSTNADIYVQRLNASGTLLWTANGVVVCNATGNQVNPQLVHEAGQGVTIAWDDFRAGAQSDIYGQFVSIAGNALWTANGLSICNATGNQNVPFLLNDGGTGAVICWNDYRNGATSDLYAQRTDILGAAAWTSNGIAISDATGSQDAPVMTAYSTGSIIAFQDRRSGNFDLYIQNVCNTGVIGSPAVPTNLTPAQNLTICSGNTTTLFTNGIGTRKWYDAVSGGTLLHSGNNYTTPVLTVTDTFYVQQITTCGTSPRLPIVVTVNPLPVVSLGSDITQCGGNVTLDAGTTGDTYSWSTGATSQTIIVTTSGVYSVASTNGNGCVGRDTVNVTINPFPVVNLGNDITQCGAVTLDAGNVGSTYLWSDNSTSQMLTTTTSGTYSVVVTTVNGCTSGDVINVTSHPLPVVALGNDIGQCGGTVTLDAQNAGATYLWNTSEATQTIVVSANGNYSVQVTDANGCTGTDAINVDIYAVPTVVLGNDTTLCGPLTLNAGNSGSTYLWSDNSTGQSLTASVSGTYSVVVTTVNGCTGTDAIDVTSNALPVVALGSDINQCGDSVVLDAQNAGSTFVWNTSATTQSITATSSGTYHVQVTDGNGCSASDTINVVINIVDTSVTTGFGSFTANAGGASYQWIDCGNGNTPVSGATAQTFVPSTNGTYAVVVTQNSCTDTSGCYSIQNVGIGENHESVFSMYPNPAGEQMTIVVPRAGVIQLFSATGEVVLVQNVIAGKNIINTEVLSAGLYVARFTSNQATSSQRLIVE